MTRFDALTLTRHVRELAAACKVDLILDAALRPEEAGAATSFDRQAMRVIASPVIDETTYAVVLHELGHCLAPAGVVRANRADRDNLGLKQHEEDAAWEWARHNALEWTAVMETVAAWARGTYDQPLAVHPQRPPTPPTVRVNSDAGSFSQAIKWGKKR